MRVIIAEDSVLLREGLSLLLTEAGIEVITAVEDATTLIAAVDKHQPDLIIVDVRMPPTFTDEGLAATLMIRKRWPNIGVLILSQYVEERHVRELITDRNPQQAGFGYLLKDRVSDIPEFLTALERINSGGSALDPELVAQLLLRRNKLLDSLTPREHEVLSFMAQGLSNSSIATELHIGAGSIEKHINAIIPLMINKGKELRGFSPKEIVPPAA